MNGEIQSIRRDDNANVPVCGGNRDYQQYLEDVKSHGPYPEDVIPDPVIANPRDLAAEIDAIKPILDDLLLGGV